MRARPTHTSTYHHLKRVLECFPKDLGHLQGCAPQLSLRKHHKFYSKLLRLRKPRNLQNGTKCFNGRKEPLTLCLPVCLVSCPCHCSTPHALFSLLGDCNTTKSHPCFLLHKPRKKVPTFLDIDHTRALKHTTTLPLHQKPSHYGCCCVLFSSQEKNKYDKKHNGRNDEQHTEN